MEKSSNKAKGDKRDKKGYSYNAPKRRSASDSSSDSDEHIKSHRRMSKAHKHRYRHSRSPVKKRVETQSIECDGKRCNSKEERVLGETDKKQRLSYDDRYKEESQKKSCTSADESEQFEFSFQKYYYELKVILRDEDLVPDSDDFWKFLKNYETVQKRAGGRKQDIVSAGKKELQIQVIFII
jgi:hypothetical protein